MRKLSSLILVVILCLAMVSAAYAENPTENNDSGIIDAQALDKLIEDFAAEKNVDPSLFSIGFIYTATGDSYYYNDGEWYYSASVYKLPNCMKLSEKLASGEISEDTVITNQYGKYSVADLLKYSIVYSNNDTGHTIVEYLGGTYSGKCAEQFIEYTTLDESYFDQNFFDVSYYSAHFITEVLNTLYTQPERFPHITDLMNEAMSGQYFELTIKDYEVAQKYGAYIDNSGRNWNNNVGIIYTPNPILVSVLTKNVSNYEQFIADAAKLLTDYALTLDTELDSYLAAQNAPVETPEPSEELEEAAEEAVEHEVTSAVIGGADEPTAINVKDSGSSLVLILGIAAAVSVLAVIAVFVIKFKAKEAAKVSTYRGKHSR